MKLAKEKKVTFVELPGSDLHKYILTRRKGATPEIIVGVTTMMRHLGIGKTYAGVNPDLLAKASARGTAIHELLQQWEMTKTSLNIIRYDWTTSDGEIKSATEDCEGMIRNYSAISEQCFDALAVEYLISDDDCIASMVDFVSKVDEHTVDLIDYKSSNTLDRKALQWQLSIYRRLFERANKTIKVRNLIGIHCHNKNVKKVIVDYLGDELVDHAVDCYKRGVPFTTSDDNLPTTLTLSELVPSCPEMENLLDLRRKLQAQVDELDEALSSAMDELKDRMAEENITEVKVPGGRYSLVAGHESSRFDAKKFRDEYPELAEKYTKTSAVAPALKFYRDR